MAKITYLMGAGASCKALPMVNQIPERLHAIIDILSKEVNLLDINSYFNINPSINSKSKQHYQLEMRESLVWLMEKSRRHASVDTFAKKLFIKGSKKELRKLKIALTLFFILEQRNNEPDYRYDAFLASILKSSTDLPNEISIISWNYDNQLELAMAEYIESEYIMELLSKLNVSFKSFSQTQKSGFQYLKINGSCIFFDHDNDVFFPETFSKGIDKNFIEAVTESYVRATYLPNYMNLLSFSWEEENKGLSQISILDKITDCVKDSEVIVIIGYSFPFFNRDIDKAIFDSFYKLNKVYIQDPSSNTIKERLLSISSMLGGVEIHEIKETNQFYLPNEL